MASRCGFYGSTVGTVHPPLAIRTRSTPTRGGRPSSRLAYSRTSTVHPYARGDDVPCCSYGKHHDGARERPEGIETDVVLRASVPRPSRSHRPTRASLLP